MSAKLRFSRRWRSRGFTLVELIVATAITMVLATMLIGVTSGILSAWNRSRGGLTSSNQAKLALDQLATDLEGAMFRADGNAWLAATILETNNPAATTPSSVLNSDRNWLVSGADSVTIKPRTLGAGSDARGFVLDAPEIGDCRFGMAGVWLRFFTTKLDDNSSGTDMSAPAAVSYQIVRRRVGSGSGAECLYMLYRSVVRTTGAPGTFQTGYNLDPAAGNAYSSPSGTDGDPGNVVRPHAAQVIANNVIDCGARFFVREGAMLRLIFPAQPSAVGAAPLVGVPSDSDVTVPIAELSHLARSAFNAADAYRNRFPDVVEFTMRILTDEGSRQIQSLEAGRVQGNWWDIALAHSQVYTRRIELKARGI